MVVGSARVPPPPNIAGARGGKMAPAAAPLSRAAGRGGGGRASPRARPSRALPLSLPLPPSLPRAAPPSCKRTTGGAELCRCLCLSPSPPAGLPSPGAGGPEPAGKAFRKGHARPPAQPTSAGCVRGRTSPFPSALSPSPHRALPPEDGASSPSPQRPCGRGALSWAVPFLGCRRLLAVRRPYR